MPAPAGGVIMAAEARRNSDLVEEEELKSWLGYAQRTALERHLQKSRIPYIYGAGGRICTTIGAINSTLVSAASAMRVDSIEFE